MESGKVEIVSELEVDELAVLRVLRVAEVMRGEKDAFKELLGDSRKTHE